jgi:hypothetical protein
MPTRQLPRIRRRPNPRGLRCSFCGKAKEQVAHLIAGPGVFICDECIRLCNQIIAKRQR